MTSLGSAPRVTILDIVGFDGSETALTQPLTSLVQALDAMAERVLVRRPHPRRPMTSRRPDSPRPGPPGRHCP